MTPATNHRQKETVSPETHNRNDNEAIEQAHVLFIDVVGFSLLPLAEQKQTMQTLQDIVRHCLEYRRAAAEQQLVRLPAGDGIALAFLNHASAPLRCAVEIARKLQEFPAIKVRMGAHSGAVMISTDINAVRNVVGSAVNLAHRVMTCGDAGHILASRHLVECLPPDSTWHTMLQPLGECVVKHQMRIQLYNLCDHEIGNNRPPSPVKAQQKTQKHHNRLQLANQLTRYVSNTFRMAHLIYPMLMI